jgi:SAM-dependent methyltransferase
MKGAVMSDQAGSESHQGPPAGGFDPQEFSEHIREEWDAVADEWGQDDWSALVEQAAGGISERLLDMARVGPGDRVVDLGTGVGEPAARAARRVGESGRVIGIDLAPRMISAGRRRIRRLGLDGIVSLQIGNAGDPKLPAGSFDAVVSRWVLMLVPDLGGALKRIRPLLVPGGRIAVGLWGHPSRVPMISLALGVAQEMVDRPPPPPGAPSHLWMSGADGFAALLDQAGYDDVEARPTTTPFRMPSPEAYAEFIVTMAGPLRLAARSMTSAGRGALAAALADAARRFAGTSGPFTMVNETLCMSARRPT